MTKPFVVSIPHQLGAVEAKRRLETGIEQVKEQYVGKFALLNDSWAGNRLDFTISAVAQTVSGVLDVGDDQVVLSVQLPWVLALLAEKIQPLIQKKAHLMLEKK